MWEKVARKLRSGEMPPSTVRSRPDPRIAAALVTHVETTLDRAAVSQPNPGRAPVHRLNRAEYSNAVRDLLAVDVRPGEWLPVDDSGYGFDNIAAVLSTSPALLDRYMSAARKVSRLAVGDLTLKPVEEIYDAKKRSQQGDPQRAVERRVAVRLPRRHDGRSLFPARRRIRLQAPDSRRATRRRGSGDRSVPGAARGESRTPHRRRDIAAREPQGRKRRACRRRRGGRGGAVQIPVAGGPAIERRAPETIRRAGDDAGGHQADHRRPLQPDRARRDRRAGGRSSSAVPRRRRRSRPAREPFSRRSRTGRSGVR